MGINAFDGLWHICDNNDWYARIFWMESDRYLLKFYCANVLQKVVDYAIQVHGALGVTDDLILSSYYRHERASRIYDGADEVHKSRLARLILKSYKK